MSFPVLFTIDGSGRHEVILISSKTSLSKLSSEIGYIAAQSPNCSEFMSKYKKKEEGGEKVGEIKVRWSSEGRDSKTWPQTTIITEENCEAVLKLIEPSKDTLDIHIG
jgi:hypothetical protein